MSNAWSPHPYLRSWETILRPSKWMRVLVEESVLLFYSKPRMLILGLVHHLLAQLAVVGVRWLLVVLVGITHDEYVVPSPEWVRVKLDRVKVCV